MVYTSLGRKDEKLWEIVLDLDFLTKQEEVYIKTVVFNHLHSVPLMREEFMHILKCEVIAQNGKQQAQQ